ncbi:MAG: ribosome biogenesis GTPase Der [Planctomycetota bacterium]
MAGPLLPRLVIVGRPNVGKSTLLNRLCRSRVAIVEPTEGVTRDRVSVPVLLDAPGGRRPVEIIDTGGIGIVDRDDLGALVEEQIRAALLVADVVLFVVDARAGLAPLDEEVARRLRILGKPVLLVVNKVEGEKLEWEVDSFRALGIGERILPISAQNGTGIDDLVAAAMELLPAPTGAEELPHPALKIAIVGRRNAGKSTLVNTLAREERAIVSEVPGTTRDALDVVIERDGEVFVLIDTAGVRRRKSHADAIEFFSYARSHKAIRRADVVILLFDATERLSDVEKTMARYIRDHHKAVILGANKWDLTTGLEPADFRTYLDHELSGLAWAPVSFLSAKHGMNVAETFALARELHAQSLARVGTGELNRVLERALEARSPSAKGSRVRILYATQTGVGPPTFVLFVNDRRLIGKSYLRYLENRLREELPFAEVPIHIVLRDKRESALPEPN